MKCAATAIALNARTGAVIAGPGTDRVDSKTNPVFRGASPVTPTKFQASSLRSLRLAIDRVRHETGSSRGGSADAV